MTVHHHATAPSSIRAQVHDLVVAIQHLQGALDLLSPFVSGSLPDIGPIGAPGNGAIGISRETPGTRRRGFRFGSHFRRCYTKKELYIEVWRTLWSAQPSRRNDMVHACRLVARNRRYVATSREQLFSGRPVAWCKSHSSSIGEGWYVDTNLSGRQMRTILGRIIPASGLAPDARPEITWTEHKLSDATPPPAGESIERQLTRPGS